MDCFFCFVKNTCRNSGDLSAIASEDFLLPKTFCHFYHLQVPSFIPIKPINATDNYVSPSASVLLTLERFHTDDLIRHARKRVSYQNYVLRSYIYMARKVVYEGYALPNLSVRVSCAGNQISTKTEESNVRPTWMQMLELNITLLTDHPKKPPTMEPISVALENEAGSLSSKEDLGRALCRISYMRQKDDLGEWEPFEVRKNFI